MDYKLIYIVDDEKNICNIIKSFLVKEGYLVETYENGECALDAFRTKPADMLIIDIMMPRLDGYSLCSKIREISSVPIIMVSAKDSEPDKIAGLTLGSDDYLTKPFSPMELVARVKAIFRRITLDRCEHVKPQNTVQFSDITVHPDAQRAECNGRDVGLTVMEFNLFTYLIDNKHRALSRNELLNKIWGFESEPETRAVDDMVKRIRKKLASLDSLVNIETIWGFGFRICDRSARV